MTRALSLRAVASGAAGFGRRSRAAGKQSHGRPALLLVTRLLSLVILSLCHFRAASAQSGLDLEATASYSFGEQITFVAQLRSPAPVQQATLVILDAVQGISHVRPVTFTDGRSEFTFDTRQNKVRPFSDLTWYYQLTLADGASAQSPTQSLYYADDRYAWQSLPAGNLEVLWTQGDTSVGQSALNAALAGLQAVSNLVPTDLSEPVRIYLYPSLADIMFLTGQLGEAGQAYPDLGVVLVAAEPGPSQSVDLERRIPHELMHVMLYRQVGPGYRTLPAWLSEGLATLAELNPTPDYEQVLQNASQRNDLIPLRDLCSAFPAEAASAFLAYAEARSFAGYLRDTYGSPALLNLAQIYAGGVTCEAGFQNAFGASLEDLDAAWRKQALGQQVLGAALRNMSPYLILLALLILLPFFSGMVASRPKAGSHDSGSNSNR